MNRQVLYLSSRRARTKHRPSPPQSPGGHGAQRPRAGSPSAEQPILSPSTTALPRWSHVPTSQVRPQGRSQTQDAHSLCCTPAFHLPWGTLPASPGSHSLGRGPGSCPRPQARPLWEAGNGLVQRTCCGPCSRLRPSFLRAWKRPFKGAETCPPHSLSALLGQVRPPLPPPSQPLILTPPVHLSFRCLKGQAFPSHSRGAGHSLSQHRGHRRGG